MKQFKYPLIALALVFFAYCKTTTKTASTPAAPPEVKKVGYVPSAKQMEAAEKRWPGVLASDVSEGQNIYITKCAECHMAYDIMEFGEKKWIHEIEKMSPKANLTPDEKLKLSKHILSYREANAPVKPN